MFIWLTGLISIVVVLVVVYADSLTGKRKSSHFFQDVQKPVGKREQAPIIPESAKYDRFWTKLNALN